MSVFAQFISVVSMAASPAAAADPDAIEAEGGPPIVSVCPDGVYANNL